MASEDSDFQEKTEEPSQYRIDESRRKGEVASSKELNSILVLTGTSSTLLLSTVFIFETIRGYTQWLLNTPLEKLFSSEGVQILVMKSCGAALTCVAPILAVAFLVGFFAQVSQIGFLYAPEVLNLKFERINPVNGFKRLFSKKSLVEATKGFLKFLFILGITYYVLKDDLPSFTGFLQSEFHLSFIHGKMLIVKVFMSIVAGMFIIALGDFAWEKYSYKKKLMMSKQELKEESKERDGNPEVKQRIRSIQREAASKRMMAEIPTADVIITNPTHFSVALKYDMANMVSPQVVAKGVDHLALKIRKMAKDNDVPIVENIPLARTLYKTVEVGEPIPRNLYQAVAEILAFVFKLKRSKKALS